MLNKLDDVLSDVPGSTDLVGMGTDVGEATPIAQSPYSIPEKVKEGVRKELERLRESGIIVPSTSPWSFSLVPVQKPDGTIRVCVDYRKLNQVTKSDPHYMPMLAEIVSKLDLTKGYYQARMKEEDQPKTTFLSIWQVSIHTCSILAQECPSIVPEAHGEGAVVVQRICWCLY